MAINDSSSLKNDATSKDYKSQLKPYSLGMLTANKGAGTEMVDVMLIELSWATHGEVNNNYTQETVEGLDINGEKVKYSVVSSNNITAAWLPMGNSNRISPPELRRGMIVMVYKDSDNNYYWVDTGMNRELMRAESVTYAYCANGDTGDNKKVSQDDWYVVEINPRGQQLMITTSASNGEYTTYDIVLNTKDGVLKINDGLGNLIMMDSRNIQHRMENQRGTFIEMLGDDINLNAVKDLNITAGGKITVKAGSDVSYNVSGKVEYTVSGNYIVNSASYILNPSSGSGTAHGSMNIDGAIKTGKNIHAGGNITADGNIDCKH